MSKSPNKKKATAKEHATRKMAERDGGGGGSPKLPTSEKERSQSRYPGETPLTGEDRPSTTTGPKVNGQIPQDTKRPRPRAK